MIQELTDWLGQIRTLVLVFAGVTLLVVTIAVGVMKRSLLAAFGTLIFGALLLWGMANSEWLKDKTGEDLNSAPAIEATATGMS